MSELDDFLTSTLDRQTDAERALLDGDPGPPGNDLEAGPGDGVRGKVLLRRGWDEVSDILRCSRRGGPPPDGTWLATRVRIWDPHTGQFSRT